MGGWFEFPRFKGSKEFIVEGGDFSQLEIRSSGVAGSLHYFYDKKHSRLVTDFVLNDGAKVATICTVTLVHNDGTYTPRLKFWKKDKTKLDQPFLSGMPDIPDTRTVKALVDTSDGHENFWVLVKFLQECHELALPAGQFKIVGNDSVEIAKLLQSSDKTQVVEALKSVLGSSLTQAELDIISNRKGQLKTFYSYLTDGNYFEQRRKQLQEMSKNSGPEAIWQSFFEENPWIFGYGLSLISCRSYDDEKLEQITTGASRFGGAGKRSDSLLRTRGIVSSLLFCEIKRHDTQLLEAKLYRPPDVYAPHREVVGAVSQVQKTAEKAVRNIGSVLHRQYDPDGTPTDLEVSTVKPRQVVVIGSTDEFESGGRLNHEKVASFELYRRSVSDVEIITFDELYERACFIVQDK